SPGRKIYIREERKYVKELIFVRPKNLQKQIWSSIRLGSEGVKVKLRIEEALPNTEYENYLRNLLFQADTLFFEYSPISLDKPLTRDLEIINKAKERLYNFETASVNNKIINLREIKSSSEIELIKKAIEITCEAHKNIMKSAKPGMYEYELEAIMEYTFKKNGARRSGFLPIIASGPYSYILHYNKNDREIDPGEIVVIDIGAEYKMYTADISRTIPISGKFSQRQKEIYNIVLKAHNEAISLIKPGRTKDEIHKKAVDIISEGLVNIGLIKDKKEYKKYYMHGTSHPIGLDVHAPSISKTLKPGMIITIEPGIYIREENLGIRIEDDILITETGYEILSNSVPVIIEEIENFMQRY
ncbi:MAG: aminopeptidase P family protein, partial [Candidatus Helarchaeota archaeon]|nr:aminopeptidase P family protein [Candidatus Helarchaeota archaeon]